MKGSEYPVPSNTVPLDEILYQNRTLHEPICKSVAPRISLKKCAKVYLLSRLRSLWILGIVYMKRQFQIFWYCRSPLHIASYALKIEVSICHGVVRRLIFIQPYMSTQGLQFYCAYWKLYDVYSTCRSLFVEKIIF